MSKKTVVKKSENKKTVKTIKLFLADDHAGIRDSLAEYLNEHEELCVVGTASNGAEILSQVEKLRPDMVLMDIDMPEKSGISAAQELIEKMPQIKIVMFSAYTDDSYKLRAFMAGACAYIEKSEDLEKTVETILNVARQEENGLSQALRRRLDQLAQSCAAETLAHDLTPAEINVLDFLKDGKELKKAAGLLNMSVKTLECHLTRINSKLGAANLREAIFNAVRLNIISIR